MRSYRKKRSNWGCPDAGTSNHIPPMPNNQPSSCLNIWNWSSTSSNPEQGTVLIGLPITDESPLFLRKSPGKDKPVQRQEYPQIEYVGFAPNDMPSCSKKKSVSRKADLRFLAFPAPERKGLYLYTVACLTCHIPHERTENVIIRRWQYPFQRKLSP